MSAPWAITNTSAAGAAATANQAAPAGGAASNTAVRLRAIQATLAGASAGSDTLQVKDGNTVIAAYQMAIAANGAANLALSDLDIRATPGNTLTVAFANGVANDVETVSAQGDFVPAGRNYGEN